MVGKKREMQARLEQHKERMAQWASQLPKGTRVAFGTSREQQFNLHTQETWTGSVLASLGLNVPAAMAGASMPSIGLEQLLAVNPAWLLVAHYREESIVKRWQQDPPRRSSRLLRSTVTPGRGCAVFLLQSVLPLTR